ncbi:MAG: phosphoglycerate kinase [Filifactoraceae bacterium]
MNNKKTLNDIEVRGKKVIVRCDFNVPMDGDKITDDRRIVSALETIKYLINSEAKVILMSHLGRPKDCYDPKYSLKPIADKLSELLSKEILFAEDEEVVGENAIRLSRVMKSGDILLLENVRFVKGETNNDLEFAKKLSELADIFVNDAFGTAHRAHSSTAGIAEYLPSVMGKLIEKEVEIMGNALNNPQRPFVAILGGAKVSDKILVIESLLSKVDKLIIGGAMAYTFKKAQGKNIGTSLVEDDKLEVALEILKKAKEKNVEILLPLDFHVSNEFSDKTNSYFTDTDEIPDDYMGLDIGPRTIEAFKISLESAKTVIWNGPMGVFEMDKFAKGTETIANILSILDAITIIGGGDSAAAVEKLGYAEKMTHISTGGGASLEFLEGKILPGIDVLDNK